MRDVGLINRVDSRPGEEARRGSRVSPIGGSETDTPLPSICFVAQRAGNLLSDGAHTQHIGGAETQQVLLARGLRERGYNVSIIVHDHGQPDGEVVDGIRLFKSYRPESGWPGIRFLHPRLTGLWSALARADADIYYQRGAESETGLVGQWCHRHGRRFVFALAGHHVLSPDSPSALGWKERVLCRRGIAQADLILVQSFEQQKLMRDTFGRHSRVVRNGCAAYEGERPEASHAEDSRSGVLWVGRFDAVKRLEWCLDLAERLSETQFAVIGAANAQSGRALRLEHRARKLRNVALVGYVPPASLRAYYRSSAVLLCTSVSEGFPNTFLESWQVGTPVVSTVDPDGVIVAHGLGRVARTIDGLAVAVEQLCRGSETRRKCATHCVEYVDRYHNVDVVVSQLHDYLTGVVSGPSTASRW